MKSLLVTSGDFIFTMICAGVKQLKRQIAALLGINYDSLPNSCASSPFVPEVKGNGNQFDHHNDQRRYDHAGAPSSPPRHSASSSSQTSSGALWLPRPNLRVAVATWIFAGGAHHTSCSFSVTPEYLRD